MRNIKSFYRFMILENTSSRCYINKKEVFLSGEQ